MKEHFVNGRPWNEVLTELRQFVQATKEKIQGSGQFYHGIEEYVQLFDSVLGNDHYTVEFSDQNYIQIRSEQDIISVKCRITILGDDGEVILFKESYGGYDLRYSNTSDKESNLNNAPYNACTSAFRSCCKFFGAFGEYSARDERSAQTSKANNAQNRTRHKAGDRDKEVLFVTEGEFYQDGTDKKGEPIYKVRAHRKVDDKLVAAPAEIVFYPEFRHENAEKYNELLDYCKDKSCPVKFIVVQCNARDGVEQFITKKFA